MIVHHIVTIGLLFLSYINNFTRAGTTILFLHDVSDVFLELSKSCHYVASAGKSPIRLVFQKLCDVTFVTFACTFAYTRLYHLPWRGVYVCLIYSQEFHGPTYTIMWLLLATLQCLHFFWFYLILRMIVKLCQTGEVEKDERSDDESFPEDGASKNLEGAAVLSPSLCPSLCHSLSPSSEIKLKTVKTNSKSKASAKKTMK